MTYSKNASVQEEYARWLSLSKPERKVDGVILDTKGKFSQFYEVDVTTMWKWEKDPTFRAKVHALRVSRINIDATDILDALMYKAVQDKDVPAIKLALEYINEYAPKQIIETVEKGGATSIFTSEAFLTFFAESFCAHELIANTGLEVEQVVEVIKQVVEYDED